MSQDEEPLPWDAGLQNERTGLAWQRTMLSGLASGLILARLLAEVSLTLAILTGVVSLGAAAAFGWVALRRFRLNARALATGRHLDDARPAALASGLLVLTALAAVGYVLLA
ncbi:hypothetical protein GCM10022197_18550 [Microlunatus spumicola]|uniref:DUF202 domain-containing protein n=1 Tax=Microlunatus spumicola TaxID=81499 RepID=A0ABP6X9Q2_9ACTN